MRAAVTGGVVEIAHIGICCQLRFIITWQLSEPLSAGNSHVLIGLLLLPSLADTEDNRDDVRAPRQYNTNNIIEAISALCTTKPR